MLNKSIKNNNYWKILIVVGLVAFIFGIVSSRMIPASEHGLNMFSGMVTGLGGAFAVVGTLKLIRQKRMSAEELKREEIELKDERNIQLLRIAHSIANSTATVLFALMAFGFAFFDYMVPAFISIGAMLIQVSVFHISYSFYSKKI